MHPVNPLTQQHIGIAGAGLLGRLLAWQLARAGHVVEVFDPSPDAAPRWREALALQGDASTAPQAAAFTAAGMLSPLAELDNAEPAVAALGWRSLQIWRAIAAALPQQPFFAARGSLMLAHREDAGSARRVLDRLQTACATPQWQQASPRQSAAQALDAAALHLLEPAVQAVAHAWLLPGEGQVDTAAMLHALLADASATGRVTWHWGQGVRALRAQGERAALLQLAGGGQAAFDCAIDVRGVGAKPDLPVRGVRGEVLTLHCPGHGLQRPLRLLHPRHRVYIVPRPGDRVLVGASELESEDRSPVSLRGVVELLAAAHSVLPALAEARIEHLDVNLRPALPDNNPLARWQGRCLSINGLFRHGWLLAPALVEGALAQGPLAGSALDVPAVDVAPADATAAAAPD
ncbi:MAG: FAD-dependent oxidoreductase [Burkholderiaceae bacterium]|jgi:glycine oxidase|nr:FAD-dependent oxidoreductase [Burkholderiaceae bacterium]